MRTAEGKRVCDYEVRVAPGGYEVRRVVGVHGRRVVDVSILINKDAWRERRGTAMHTLFEGVKSRLKSHA